MRVISGKLKGKSIDFIKNTSTRPLKDFVKENIFNILSHSRFIDVKIQNTNILDLYSGVGSFGIECISRGADKVTFVESNIKASNILKENLIALSIIEKTKIINDKIENYLNFKTNNKFDIFFLDPPFVNNDYLLNLELIKKNNIFKKKNIVIIHRESKTEDNLEKYIKIIEVKTYARSKIIFGKFS